MATAASHLQLDQEASPPLDFFDFDIDELIAQLTPHTEKKYHAASMVRFAYKHLKPSIQEMSSLPQKLRDELPHKIQFAPLKILKRTDAADGCAKFLFEVQTPKGPESIEAVYIPEEKRTTLCISSQVGCKMACDFCLTGQLGFKNNLSTSDIVRQVWTVNLEEDLSPITNIVFMGMGEPFDNFENVKRATRILSDPRAFELSARKITVSTVGMVDKIDQLEKEDNFRLAVSLNSSDDKSRSSMMPVNKRWNIDTLLEACRRYSQRTNKKVTFEYILMEGLTDRDEDAERLIKLFRDTKSKINLIPYNENNFTDYKRPSAKRIDDFYVKLVRAKLHVFVRKTRGQDVYAACGMLKKVDASTL